MPFGVNVEGFSRSQGGLFSVHVDSTDTTRILTMVDVAIGPPQLAIWLDRDVHPYLVDEIVNRFAYNGTGGTHWAPLAESTIRLRNEMGIHDDFAINERTGEMLEHLMTSRDISVTAMGSSLEVPGGDADDVMAKKLKTAQEGNSEWNPLFQTVTHTPARPVLELTTEDMTAILFMLQTHIMNLVGFLHMPLGSL